MSDTVWESKVEGLLKMDPKGWGVAYAQLVDKLAALDVIDTKSNMRKSWFKRFREELHVPMLQQISDERNTYAHEVGQILCYAIGKLDDIADPALEQDR